MKIGIASDHHGIKAKAKIKKYLEHLGHDVIDYGSNNLDSVDYPIYAFKVGESLKKEVKAGIIVGTEMFILSDCLVEMNL